MSGARPNRAVRRRLAFIAVAALALVPPCVGAQGVSGAPSSGSVSGTVRDTAGRAVGGASVSAGGTLATVADSAGAFRLRGVPRGSIQITVRRLGFEPETSRVEVGNEPVSVDVRLTPVAAMLATVRVRARPEPYDSRLAGFNERRSRKLGYFITREQIERRNDTRLSEALRQVPGVRPYTMRGALGRSVTLPGSHCPPVVFVDGFAANLGSFDLDMIDLSSVEGIEVYPNGSSVPAAFLGSYGSEECGVIAIWSAPARPKLRANQLPPEPVDVDALVKNGSVYRPESVEVQARYVAGSARPIYPDSLLRGRVAGRVVARFAVDTGGHVEEATITIVSASAPAFGTAVRDALPDARFRPAETGGRKVRALVTLPFDFDPTAPEGDSTTPGK